MKVNKVGVVGFGLMGKEIGRHSAQTGYPVLMYDISQELVDKGISNVKSLISYKGAKRKISKEETEASLARIKGTTSLYDFSDCDLVIESVIEKIDIKKKIFALLDKICKKNSILATNTSSLSVTDLASVTQRMPQVLGMHFFSQTIKCHCLKYQKQSSPAMKLLTKVLHFFAPIIVQGKYREYFV